MSKAPSRIRGISVRDIRFPTSLDKHGSDAIHKDPDYSCAYVVVYTDQDLKGYGSAFTLGRGTELVVQAVKLLAPILVGHELFDIFSHFDEYWRRLTSESQLRWVGPEKGVIHLAAAALVNAVWDLWSRLEKKPLWKLLVDMDAEKLVKCIDFRYLSDVITKEEAIGILQETSEEEKEERERDIRGTGYPAYTTQAGWIGYDDEKLEEMCYLYMREGFTAFKIKVGSSLEDDLRRCQIVRDSIGWNNRLMIDANQKFDVQEAIDWVKQLAHFKPYWIEEPTSPDDIWGHLEIVKALTPMDIGVATGEMCQNRVMFKQFLAHGALQFCQIDATRLGGVNEILTIYIMAKKFGVPVCPHAGGVGLCEMVQHLQIFDYIRLTGTTENRMIEHADRLHQHFKFPVCVEKAHYQIPKTPGYSTEMWEKALIDYEYPIGSKWKELFKKGKFRDPTKGVPQWIEDRCFVEESVLF